MTPDPYDHVREAFHTVADGLMGWEDPPPTLARVTEVDVEAIERLSDAAIRAKEYQTALEGYTLALRLRRDLAKWGERVMPESRYVTDNISTTQEPNPERFRLFRLCHCPTCGGLGKALADGTGARCPDCRGEGRIRQEIATCATPEAVGVAIVTLAREGEWEECPLGLLDSMPDCPNCAADGWLDDPLPSCPSCKGTGIKLTGTWLISPWLPSARNVTDAARTLAKSKKKSDPR